MDEKVSVVVNTLNEENNIERAIKSTKNIASEVLVCDMYSEDQTVQVARKLGARIVFHKKTGYVEPARNFAISQAKGDWILVLDADEEIPTTLAQKLKEIIKEQPGIDYVEIPRRNIIFGKKMQASGWWPDYNIRFFKKGSVVWQDQIHSKPEVKGQGSTLPSEEDYAIIHNNYSSVSQFLDRLNRYSDIQAKELKMQDTKFSWIDLLNKPLSEFLTRYFVKKGYEDGLHGLILSLLQAFSFLVVYVKLWELCGQKEQELSINAVERELVNNYKELDHWLEHSNISLNPFQRAVRKAKNKLI